MSCTASDLDRAAQILRAGGLVAFPTETVYGLGANALDAAAVRRVFAAKGRPATSPLIVHVAQLAAVVSVVQQWPESAAKLAERFWPGPLTLVLRKQSGVPQEVTAGLETVGIRMPAHPVALELIRRAGVPLAAPSANRFTEISPTTAEHVRRSLGDRVDMILDGGPSEVGIESTVISLVEPVPTLLRPGHITQAELESVIGPVVLGKAPAGDAPHASPGLHLRHYAPRTPLRLLRPGDRQPSGNGSVLRLPSNSKQYAAALYAALHEADIQQLDWIAVESPPETAEWAAVRDRLQRASVSADEETSEGSQEIQS